MLLSKNVFMESTRTLESVQVTAVTTSHKVTQLLFIVQQNDFILVQWYILWLGTLRCVGRYRPLTDWSQLVVKGYGDLMTTSLFHLFGAARS